MNELICFFKGHAAELRMRKELRLIHWGETAPQYRTVFDTTCTRCGKWQHPVKGVWLGV